LSEFINMVVWRMQMSVDIVINPRVLI
jgi:hypothetical protein